MSFDVFVNAALPYPMTQSWHIGITNDGEQCPLTEGQYLLAQVNFAQKPELLDPLKPIFNVGLLPLDGVKQTEWWLSTTPVRYGKYQSVTYSENGDILFGHLLLEEADFADFRLATQTAYKHIFELLAQSGYEFLVRIWNYFPAITALQGELNRYQIFCLGRQDALDSYGNFAYAPPAATAIGTVQAGLQIYFIAAKRPGIQLENPRQTSAFLYPRQYGPVSPAFSRATVKEWGESKHIYISGTTSIVGHQTLHKGDVTLQLAETLLNLQALLQHGEETLGLPVTSIQTLLQLKVYVQSADVLPVIKAQLQAYLGESAVQVLYLQGDVCRPDLMVEIEGIYV